MSPEESFQELRTMVFLIPRGLGPGGRALPLRSFQQPDGVLLLPQFVPIPLVKFLPPARVMAEPLAQLRAWGNVLQPHIHGRALPGQAAGPQPLHQDAETILSGRLFVNS